MNRFNKTRRRVMRAVCLLLFVICIAITTALFVGVTDSKAGRSYEFTTISNEGVFSVKVHNRTGVMYAISNGTSNYGNVTLLVDAEGKPLIWEG